MGLLGFNGFAMESVTSPHHKSMDVLGTQSRVSCGRFLWSSSYCAPQPQNMFEQVHAPSPFGHSGVCPLLVRARR
eukprot:3436820-Pyramimonas_sp.AAC.1